MKLWLKGISGSWWETAGAPGQAEPGGKPCPIPAPTLSTHLPVTQGSLWLLRDLQGSAKLRLVSVSHKTWSFFLDTAAPSLAGLRASEGGQCARPLLGAGW